jgi:sarcosine oxidase subunit delta
MIVIRCPYCHELRHEDELEYGGEADVIRPLVPKEVSDADWVAYLFTRTNPKGTLYELWCCRLGCGQWYKAARDTVTHEIYKVVRLDQIVTPPAED